MKSSNKATSDNRAYLALASAFVQIYSLQFQTSDMLKSIDEVIGAIWRESDREKAIKEGLRILEFPNLRVLSVESKHLHSGMNLMKRYKELKPRDAIHLAVSLRAGVFRIVSDDPDFDDVKEIEREKLA